MGVSRMLKMASLPSMKRKHPQSKYQRLLSCFLIITAVWLTWAEGTSGETQANLTSVETWGETQIKVTWEAIEDIENKPYHYELYIDNHLEYFGKDLMYVARRLIPDTVYYFKLRSCYQDRNACSDFSKTVSAMTSISKRRTFIRAFFQWLFLWVLLILLACVTAFLGVKIFRKFWRSFLYKYDYKSETNVGPKYSVSSAILEEDVLISTLVNPAPEQKENGQKTKCGKDLSNMRKLPVESCAENICESQDVPENVISSKPKNHSVIGSRVSLCNRETSVDQGSNLEGGQNVTGDHYGSDENSKNYENSENKRDGDRRGSESKYFPQNTENGDNAKKLGNSNNEHSKNDHCHSEENPRNEILGNENSTNEDGESTSRTSNVCSENIRNSGSIEESSDNSENSQNHQRLVESVQASLNEFQKSDNAKDCFVKTSKQINPTTSSESDEIVVVVDNSNIFIGAQECGHALNRRERKRNIRVKIQQLVRVLERGRPLAEAFVQGSSPPTTDQVWEVYRRLGYCVDLEDRRGKDEQRVDEGLHLNIYKALCELSPRKLVIASGDGNKGKSDSSTSLPGCAQAALEKGWQVEVHSWQHSLSTEWHKLSTKYPTRFSVHYLDRYINNITFVDGKHGRKCQPLPTDFFKTSSVKDIANLISRSSIPLSA